MNIFILIISWFFLWLIGFIYASTKDLCEAFYSSEADSDELFKQGIHVNVSEGRVHFLRLTLDQLTIIAGVEGGQALCYDVTKISTNVYFILFFY